MNNMKKQVLPILLALIMILVPSTAAFAAGGPGTLGSAADITAFKIKTSGDAIPAVYAEGVKTGVNITVTVPYYFYYDATTETAAVDEVKVEIETAPNVTAIKYLEMDDKGDYAEWAEGTAWTSASELDFTNGPVIFQTTTPGGTDVFTVTLKPEDPSKTNDITSFILVDPVVTTKVLGEGKIIGTDIAVVVPFATPLNAMTAKIKFNGVKLSGAANSAATTEAVTAANLNFTTTGALVFTVKAQDISMKTTKPPSQEKTYTVTVTPAPATNTNSITDFAIGTAVGSINEALGTINVRVANDYPLTAVTPDIEHNGKSIQVSDPKVDTGTYKDWTAGTTTSDFTGTAADAKVKFKVTSDSNKTKEYTVTVTKDAATETNSVTFLSLDGAEGKITPATGDNATGNRDLIEVVVPYDADLSSLDAVLKHNGATLQDQSLNIISGKLTYTPAAGMNFAIKSQKSEYKYYTLKVTKAAATTTKEITSFKINDVEGDIDGQNITVTLPYGSDVRALEPVIEHTGASITPDPETAQPQSFTNPVRYTVKAQDNSTLIYTVTVKLAPPTKEITSFKIGDIDGTIGDGTVAIEVPFGSNVTALAPTIVHNGKSIAPALGIAQNFTNPVTYTVTAQDDTTKAYVVTVTVASDNPAPSAKAGWLYENGAWKYYKADVAQTGWVYDAGSWYYLTASGNMVHAQWLHDTDGKWYYLTGNGKMAIGTYTINGKTQSFAGNGVWKG
jgi:hypothetical protein